MSMIPSNYSINIAKARGAGSAAGMETGWGGKPVYSHWCRMELGHTLDRADAIRIFEDTSLRYPSPDFSLSLDYVSCSGETLRSA